MKALIGCFFIESGQITYADQPLIGTHLHNFRRSVVYIGQNACLGEQSVEDALFLPFSFKANRHRSIDLDDVKRLLTQFGLTPDILRKPTSVISGGEQQRIAIIRGILMQKKVFLLDEVTAGLDAPNRDIVLQMIKQQEATILSVSHDPLWCKAATIIYRVENGRVSGPFANDHEG